MPNHGDEVFFEMLISRRARMRYGLAEVLFGHDGRTVVADFQSAREATGAINRIRQANAAFGPLVAASDLNAAGLLHEVMHHLIGVYRDTVEAEVFDRAYEIIAADIGVPALDQTLTAMIDAFPPRSVWAGDETAAEYLEQSSGGIPNRRTVLEEMLLLSLANENPAMTSLADLFDDRELVGRTRYVTVVQTLRSYFQGQPGLEPDGPTLLQLLSEPMTAAPDSLQEQLEFIRRRWGRWVEVLVARLLGGLDFWAEEHRPVFPPGPGPSRVPVYPEPEEDGAEAFSTDRDWMPRVVMLAKNVYVWLAQLSRESGRTIDRLDQVPDSELDRLQRRGFTALWLIGVWERSRASATIKQWMGDADAVASAYSLHDYVVAGDLGGPDAFEDLKARARSRGIRMTTDMVPNHVGIDGRWVIEHPDWFIGLPECPYPEYRFTGADLCSDERVGVYLEDGYWNRSDAAVVFKRVDHWTGEARYIYHGNDGTSMPWNDTAQLDYRKKEVREAVIQTILHVARLSPIIRFDAAMTLTQKHFQRLWFPEPGTGGDIPSRSGFAMSKAAFREAMPEEFWREVVDRVAAEAPDTLLLAEAFWMLEGYFVRTLGMHRVYNSAFMNMLRDESNDEYRHLIRSTLEYDPRILSRYVNFMSNPDEETAEEQFGRGDKYFGICTLMATLPGLPMFGHGQIEGYREKYGMEFRAPRWDEDPDDGLVLRHDLQIVPLLRRRRLFSGVDQFRLYDLVTESGAPDQNVFAYSNAFDGEAALVVYHNRFGDTSGWIDHAVAMVEPWRDGDRTPVSHRLGSSLGLGGGPDRFVLFRDHVGGLEYIRSAAAVLDRGLFVQLNAYEVHVFWSFREVDDDADTGWAALADDLQGRGVADLDLERRRLLLEPVLTPWRTVVEGVVSEEVPPDALEEPVLRWLVACGRRERPTGSAAVAVEAVLDRFQAGIGAADQDPDSSELSPAVALWSVARALNDLWDGDSGEDRWDEWLFGNEVAAVLSSTETGLDSAGADAVAEGVGVLLSLEGWLRSLPEGFTGDAVEVARALLERPAIHDFLGINTWDDIEWFRGERLDDLLGWLETFGSEWSRLTNEPGFETELNQFAGALREAAEGAEFRVDRLLEDLEAEGHPS